MWSRLAGSVPKGSAVGDLICIFQGGSVPFVLRDFEGEEEGRFHLMGECYLHRFMDGESLESRDALQTLREFETR